VHRHENKNEDDVLASSKQRVDEKLQMNLMCKDVDVPVDEHR
jgi:hypothetical protein